MSDAQFNAYAAALLVGGLFMIAAVLPWGKLEKSTKVASALIGAAMAGYGGYLLFIFESGDVRVFWYALIVPVLVLVQVVKGWRNKDAQPAAEATAAE